MSYEGTDEGVPVKSSDKTICELESLLDQYYYKLVEVKSGSICVSTTDVNNSESFSDRDKSLKKMSESKNLTSTPTNSADKHKQGSLGYLMPESHTDTPLTDTVLAKKHQCVSSIGVSKLEDFSSDSVYDVSTILDSNDNADSDDTENMSTISSVTEAFSKQFTEFKDEIKSLFVQSQQEQKQLISTLVSKVHTLTTLLKQKDDEVEHLNACLESSQERTRFLEGRLCRVEKPLSDVKEDCLQQKARSMKTT